MKVILVLFFIICFALLNIVYSFTIDQDNILKDIAINCGFTWNNYQCGTRSNILQSYIGCENNEITEITIDTNQLSTCQLKDNFNYFPSLKKLTLINLNVIKFPKSLYQHDKLQILSYTSTTSNYFTLTTDDGSNDWSKMVSLIDLNIIKAGGIIPKFPTSLINFHLEQGDPQITITPRMPLEVFTNKLTNFYFICYQDSSSLSQLTENLFQLSPNIKQFIFCLVGYRIQSLSYFNQLPSSLTQFQIYSLKFTNTTMPSINEVSWDSLEYLAFSNLNIQGTFSSEFFFLPNLFFLYIVGSPSLIGYLPNSFQDTKLTHLYLYESGFTGTIPETILEGKLRVLDIRKTNFLVNSNLPNVFLCIPPHVFNDGDISFKLFIPDNVFSNFKSINNRNKCIPTIKNITNPIKVTDSNIDIYGDQLGSFTPFTQVQITFAGVPYQLYCQSSIPGKKISCMNSNYMGKGQIIVTAKNSELPEPSATINYQYSPPVIYTITQLPTLGGKITIFGQGLWIAQYLIHDKSNDYVKLIKDSNQEVLCSNLTVINALTTVSCDLPSGIHGGNIIISVNGQQSSNYPFTYQSPIINKIETDNNNLIPTKLKSDITIRGYNFWNESSLVKVNLNSIDCSIKSIQDDLIVCTFPSTPFILPDGLVDLIVFVNGQSGSRSTEMIDVYCPNNCGSSKCDTNIGMCDCQYDTFGPACSSINDNTTLIEIYNSSPVLNIIPYSTNENSTTSISIKLISIIEGQQEISLRDNNVKWSKININETISRYQWNGNNKQSLIIDIINNKEIGRNEFTSYPSNSFTYSIQYENIEGITVDKPQFQFEIEGRPFECSNLPFTLTNPTGKSYDTRYFTLSTYNTQYFGRFNKKVIINNNNGDNQDDSITTNNILINGQYARFISTIEAYSISSAKFQIDFMTFKNAISREPLISGCTLPNNDKSNDKNSNGWKIGVGIGVGIGSLALIGSGFLIFKQQVKYKKTKSLLEKKLKEINHNL